MEYTALPHFASFYLFYLSGHLNRLNRAFHVLGVAMFVAAPVCFWLFSWPWFFLIAVPFASFLCFSVGHLLCREGHLKMQGSWKWNIRALLLMCTETMNGRISRHIQLAQQLYKPVIHIN